eukprot:296028-Prorocentrum_minimum.AAC.1
MVSSPPSPNTPGGAQPGDPTSRLEQDMKSALIDFALARAGVRDIASWAGQQLFNQVYPNKKINPKELRRIWEVLEQGTVRNKNLLQLLDEGARKFYPDPDNGWDVSLKKFRETRDK